MNKLLEAVTRFFATVTSNGVSLAGSALTTVSAFLFLLLFAIHLVSATGGPPYLGILTFLILPAFFLLGLLLIPVGLWRVRKRRREAMAEDDPAAEFAVLDFNVPQVRRTALVFFAATGINALILGVGTYKGVEVMDSVAFCGTACHSVMAPEYTAYLRSPHARVKCVDCHIGAGASWFVKSKLSGSWQVVSVTFDLYPRPIPVPVQNLRPARETCEECHWPNRFVGDRFKVNTHFAEDEANTETETVLVVKVGGRQAGHSHGIHWHVNPDYTVRYRADEKQQTMYEVEMVARDGARKTWTSPAASTPEGQGATTWRIMDCIDCHNRPTHIFRSPESELDAALLVRRIDPSLPFVRREGLKALEVEYPSHEAARAGIAKAISAFYAQSYPQVAAEKKDAVAAAGVALGDIWCGNVFPQMRIRWGTYVNNAHHTLDMSGKVGCFRCHDGEHTAADGTAISQDCTLCHSILAMDEKNPAILKTVFAN
jgi:nitrate/TMAO reductase-like tetraheme cytochrome c subunit